mgnify:CR=1 FL=1
MGSYENLLLESPDPGIHVLTLNRPRALNALNRATIAELHAAVQAIAADAEARVLDERPLAARLRRRESNDEQPLVVWDVGLGAASNAMAAIHLAERELGTLGPTALRPLHLVSFERDLDSLILAARNAPRFPHVRHSAPHGLLKNGHWRDTSGWINWKLLKGDFLDIVAHQFFVIRFCNRQLGLSNGNAVGF